MIGTGRLEAFSDGVIAIIITIMVLELTVPHEPTIDALMSLWPVFLSYVISFVYIGIYWNNHHHMFHAVKRVTGSILWANLHLLFWLSLVPFVTAWMGESNFASLPTAFYGGVMLMAAVSWMILQKTIVREEQNALLKQAIGLSYKEQASPTLYLAAIIFAFIQPWISGALYIVVALMWLVPDRRIARVLSEAQE